MSKIVKILEQSESETVVEVQITVRTVIREGRSIPSMTYNDIQISDGVFTIAVHEALDGDPMLAAEMRRICDHD